MKYVREVMDLMAAYPGRGFRMAAIVRYIIGSKPDQRRRKAVREAVRLVLQQLIESGVVVREPATVRGSFASYSWKVPDEVLAKCRA